MGKQHIMSDGKLNINYWVILSTGIAAFFLSIIWYSPLLFGKIWEQYRRAPNPEIPQWTIAFAPFRELIVSFVLGLLVVHLNLKHWWAATRLMLILWLAFHAVGMAGAILWDNMQWQLGIVHAGDWLMKMLFMGTVLSIWLNKKSSPSKNETISQA